MKHKKYHIFISFIFGFSLLVSCAEQLDVNEAIINEAFDKLSINTDSMIAHDRVDNVNDPKYDRTEMVDATDKEAIYIFTSLYDEIEFRNEERLFFINSEYVYVYIDEEMARIENPFDINEENYYQSILTMYTVLFDLDFLSIQPLKEIALTLQQTTLSKRGNQFTLKGAAEPIIPIEENEMFENEFIYTETQLLQASQRHRYTYASTWQQSNFIAGIDYFFGTSALPDFPNITQFGF